MNYQIKFKILINNKKKNHLIWALEHFSDRLLKWITIFNNSLIEN